MAADAKYFVQTILNVKAMGNGAARAQKFANSISNVGDRIQRTGPAMTRTFLGLGSAIAMAAGAYGIGRFISGAIQANREMENLNFGVATTLQLFGRNKNIVDQTTGAIIGQRDAAGMFAANMNEATAATDKLFRIAATSPASFEDAQALFKNILPGIAQVEDSMENILSFSKKALSVGVLLGGDFKQAGADLRRMLTGQAGMDVRGWAEGLSTAARRAAVNMGGEFTKLSKMTGAKFTKAFNQLDPDKRYALMQEALKDLGASTEAAGNTWDGLSSAIKSDAFLLQQNFGKALFAGMKDRFRALTGAGGIANPMSESFGQLELASKVAGSFLADAGGVVFDKIIAAVEYFANNWKTVYVGLAKAFDKGLKAAKLFLLASAAKTGTGMAVSGVGGAMGGASKLAQFAAGFFVKGKWDSTAKRFRNSSGTFVGGASNAALHMKGLVSAVGGVGIAFGAILPVALLLGAALAGVGVAFAGVGAYFIENWQGLVTAISNGTVSIKPLTNVIGMLWAKMVALGGAIMGDSGVTGATNKMTQVVLLATNAIHWIIGAMALFLRAAGVVQWTWNVLEAGIKGIGLVLVSMVHGVLGVLHSALNLLPLDMLPGTTKIVEGLAGAMESTGGAMDELIGSMTKDAKEADEFFNLADTFENALDKDGGYAKALEDATKKALTDAASGAGGDGSAVQKFAPSKNITVHSLRVEMDLRDKDPDRIMGAFVRKLERVTNNPTQALTQEDYGI